MPMDHASVCTTGPVTGPCPTMSARAIAITSTTGLMFTHAWIQAWVNINPVVDVMAMARALMVGQGPVTGPVVHTLAWSIGILVVFFPLAVRAYRRRA